MGPRRIPTQPTRRAGLLRGTGLGVALGVLLTGIVSAQPAAPTSADPGRGAARADPGPF